MGVSIEIPALERFIERVAPGIAARRASARANIESARASRAAAEIAQDGIRAAGRGFGGGGFFDAAKKGPPNSTWLESIGSADETILVDLPVIRARSRDQFGNNGHAVTITDTTTDMVIGTGLTPDPNLDRELLGLTDEQVRESRKDMLMAWKRFTRYSDSSGCLKFSAQQELWFRDGSVAGDVFTREVKATDPSSPYSFTIETLEAERVDQPDEKLGTERDIRGGVELDKNLRPVAIWVTKRTKLGFHALERGSRRMLRVPIYDDSGRRVVHHWFKRLRTEQTRGLPWFTPVLGKLKNVVDFDKAKLLAQKITACLAFVVESPFGKGFGQRGPNVTTADGKEAPSKTIRPGTWQHLRPGEKLTVANPGHADQGYTDYMVSQLRAVAGAYGSNYEVGFRDPNGASWSNLRGSETQIRRTIRKIQQQFAEQMLQPWWLRVMEEAILRGEIRHITEFDADLVEALWHGPGWDWVDPRNDALAMEVQIKNGIATKEMQCRRLGHGAYADVLRKRIEEELLERQMREEAGLAMPPAPGDDPEGDESEDEDGDEEEIADEG